MASPEEQIAGSQLNSIAKSSEVFHLFEELQNSLPLDEFKNYLTKLDKYHNNDSGKTGDLARETKTHLENAVDTYLLASQAVYEWCGVAAERLESYLRLFEKFSKGKSKMQHRILIQVLEQALNKFTKAKEKLDEASRNFVQTVENTVALNADFDENSDEHAETNELKQAVGTANAKISETKAKLNDQIRVIGESKTQAQVTLDIIKDVDDIDELEDSLQNKVKNPVEKLIAESKKYRERYIEQKESYDNA